MLDLSDIPAEVLTARGAYSTVRSAHEDGKKELQERCSELMSLIPLILKHGQADDEATIQKAGLILADLRDWAGKVEPLLQRQESLARQRAELKQAAWAIR